MAWTRHVGQRQPVAPCGGAVAGPQYGAPPELSQHNGAHPDQPLHWLLPTGRSGWSIAAGYVALVAMVFWPLGPVALGLGIHAIRVAGRTGTHGRGRAIFAIVVGSLTTIALVGFLISLAT